MYVRNPHLIAMACALLLTVSVVVRAAPAAPDCIDAPAVHAAEATDNGQESAADRSFIARNEPVEHLFRAIGAEAHRPVQLSAKAKQYRVTGEFNLARPLDVIEKVTTDLGLIWYFDGRAIYVNDNSEIASTVLSMPSTAADQLVTFLRAASLYDKRYPLRYTQGSALIYLSGPPKYVEIVQSSASLLRQQADTPPTGARRVAVVRVHHAFVIDRQFAQRDTSVVVPGLASVLRDVLGDRVVVSQVTSDTRSSDRDPEGTDARPISDEPLSPSAPGSAPTSAKRFGGGPAPPLPMLDGLLGRMIASAVKPDRDDTFSPNPPLPDDDALPPHAADAPLHVVAYGSTNSLLLEGTGHQIAAAQRLIAELDVPKTQVELSLWVIDISKANLDALGAQWSADARLGNVVGVQFNPQILRHGSTLSHAQTLEFMASVTALSDEKKARIVSRPILLAQDNSPAVFDNSRSFYVKLEGERVASLDKVTFGTMISVVPRICGDNGRIEMELSIEDGNSADPSETSGLDVPVVSRTRIETVARVLRDQSLLIGGYTHDETSDHVNRIPLLGDIPVIGHAFRYRENSGRQQVRLFLIQPRLIAEDAAFDSERVARPPLIDNAVDALKQQLRFDHG
jgi:type III secretion protein C